MGLDITAAIMIERNSDGDRYPQFEVLSEFDANFLKGMQLDKYYLDQPSAIIKKNYCSYINCFYDDGITEDEVDLKLISRSKIDCIIPVMSEELKNLKKERKLQEHIAENTPDREISEDAVEFIHNLNEQTAELKQNIKTLEEFRCFLLFYENIFDRKSSYSDDVKIHCLLDFSY